MYRGAGGYPHPQPGPSVEDSLAERAKPWAELWTPNLDPFCPRDQLARADRRLPVPMPTVEQFRDFVRTYSWTTAVGADDWQPRCLGLFQDVLIERLINLMEVMVLTAVVPSHFALLVVVLIPIEGGGEQPIGISPTILKLIDTWFRWSYGTDWVQAQPSDPLY